MFDLIGKTVGPYRILEQIGVGGMATVYKAYQPSMDRYIAVKVLPAHLSRDPDFTKRFQREARAISRLEHSHILPVYDYGEYEGITYIAMRYIKAGTLKDRMSMGGLSLDEIHRLIGQIGGALDYAHRMGVIHRDVKPANILIDDQGDVYLSDFGLARMMEPTQQLTESGVGLGTPAYMSPEQGQGIKVDHRSDIYSLGVILYEMLTGRVPYEAETPMAVVFQHIHGDLPLPHSINANTPEPVERVVLKALTKVPADRYQTAGEMAQALNVAVRMMGAEEQQQTIVDQVVPAQQTTSIGTRLQRIWDQPRGKVILAGGALATVMLLGFLLIQLPGNITILAPNPNPENTPMTGLETQAATLESPAQNTSLPVTTTASLATQQVPQPASTLTSSDYGSLLYEENFDQDTGLWALDKGSSIQNGELIIPPGASARPSFDAQIFSDFIFETEFRFVNPEISGSIFAVYLRFQEPPCPGTGNCSDQVGVMSNGYILAWRPNGTNSYPQILASTGVPQLDPNKANRLTIFVAGDEFRIYVNGIFVRSFRDSTYESGIFVLDADHEATAFNHVRIYAIPSVSDAPSLPAPQGELVFDENFDDGIANGIAPNNNNWEIVDDNQGGKAFQIDSKLRGDGDWNGFALGSTSITDGTIEYKVKVIDYDLSSRGALDCNFRVTPEKTYVFYLAAVTNTVFFHYQGADIGGSMRLLDNATAAYIFEKNVWYAIRIDVKGNEFTAYIDGNKALTATDDRIKSGEISCLVAPNTVAQFDDLRVYALPSVSNVPSLPTQTLSVAMSTPEQTELLGGGTGRIFFNCGSDIICMMNVDGSDQTQLIKGGGHLSVSPDGRKIAFSSYADGQVYVMNVDGSEVRRLTNNKTSEQSEWSPDGSRIVYQSSYDGDFEIYMMNIDGTEKVQLTHNSANDKMAAWSPDGNKIAFVSERDGNPEIYVMNADGTEQQRLTSNLSDDAFPAWSPDSARIVFDSDRDGNYEIYIMKVDGSNQTRVTRNSFKDDYPAWSPDGNWIIFDSNRDGNWEVYLMKTDGTEQTRLTRNSLPDYGPAWQP